MPYRKFPVSVIKNEMDAKETDASTAQRKRKHNRMFDINIYETKQNTYKCSYDFLFRL